MVKGVATSIITVAVLMSSVVACGGTTQVVAPASEPETTVEETPEEEVAEPLSTADQFELVYWSLVTLTHMAALGTLTTHWRLMGGQSAAATSEPQIELAVNREEVA